MYLFLNYIRDMKGYGKYHQILISYHVISY